MALKKIPRNRSRKKKGNIRKYKKPLNINIGMIIFGIIFIYIIICVFMYATSNHINGYEVSMGTLSVSNVYKGVAIRQEEIVNSKYSGYVNYYAREGEKVATGNLVYTVDESGKLADMLGSGGAQGENSLTDENLLELKTDIISFVNTYNPHDFAQVYDFKYSIQGAVMKLSNVNALKNINSVSGNMVNLGTSAKPGVVIYNIDQLESLTTSQVTAETYNMEKYAKQQLISDDLVESGEPVYKLALAEEWSLVISVDEEKVQALTEDPYVKVKFLKNQQESWATASIHHNEDGYYAQLDFNNSMSTFCRDRFVDIELMTNEQIGLKIPNSSIVETEFYLIPTEYITKGGDSRTDGVMKESYGEEGSVSTQFVPLVIYSSTEDEYYVDDASLRIGDYILKPDSTEKYAISKRGKLTGVYNINKGYADFKEINILYQNDEYSIVESNTKYGLSTYDYIVLDASAVDEDDFVYE